MDNLMQRVDHYFGSMKAGFSKLDPFKRCESGMMDAVNIVMALVMIVVVGAIGIFIADKTMTATGTPSNNTLTAMLVNFLSAGNTGSSFVVILIIAFIGGIAISYLTGMFRTRR